MTAQPSPAAPTRGSLSWWLAVGLVGFTWIALSVHLGWVQSFDDQSILGLRDRADVSDPFGPNWLEETGRDVTALGSYAVLTLLTVTTGVFLLLHRRRRDLIQLIAASAGCQVANWVLKTLFSRDRPELVPHLAYVDSPSFPSGHAMVATSIYLTIASLLTRETREPGWRTTLLGVAVLLVVLIGFTRVYLGVHYPSDVIGGWFAGLAWATACALVCRRLPTRLQDAK